MFQGLIDILGQLCLRQIEVPQSGDTKGISETRTQWRSTDIGRIFLCS